MQRSPRVPSDKAVAHENPFAVRLRPDQPYPDYPTSSTLQISSARRYDMKKVSENVKCRQAWGMRSNFSQSSASVHAYGPDSPPCSGRKLPLPPPDLKGDVPRRRQVVFEEPLNTIAKAAKMFERLDPRAPPSEELSVRRRVHSRSPHDPESSLMRAGEGTKPA